MNNPTLTCECPIPQIAGSITCIVCGLPPYPTTDPKSPQKEAIDHIRNMQLDNLEMSSQIPFTPPVEGDREGKILRHCSRCGAEWCNLGKVTKYAKHYPAYTVKKADGTTEEMQADDEIKEALCMECSKEVFDSTLLNDEREKERERVVKICEEMKKKLFENPPKGTQAEMTNRDYNNYNQALSDLRDKLTNNI